MSLSTHIINPAQKNIGTVIWMHGLGADYHDFDTIVPDLWNGNQLPLRFVFPNAPIRPVTINQHMPTRAWYDIYSLTDLEREDKTGITESQKTISTLIQQEIDFGMPREKIVLAGFSQGGAMALYTGTREAKPLGGILALSCYLPLMREHAKTFSHDTVHTPILITHGTEDLTLPCLAGKMAFDTVSQTHQNVVWKEYRMGHEINPPEIKDIYQWLCGVFLK